MRAGSPLQRGLLGALHGGGVALCWLAACRLFFASFCAVCSSSVAAGCSGVVCCIGGSKAVCPYLQMSLPAGVLLCLHAGQWLRCCCCVLHTHSQGCFVARGPHRPVWCGPARFLQLQQDSCGLLPAGSVVVQDRRNMAKAKGVCVCVGWKGVGLGWLGFIVCVCMCSWCCMALWMQARP